MLVRGQTSVPQLVLLVYLVRGHQSQQQLIVLSVSAAMRVHFQETPVFRWLRNVTLAMQEPGQVQVRPPAWPAVLALGHPLLEPLIHLIVRHVTLVHGVLWLVLSSLPNVYCAIRVRILLLLERLYHLSANYANRVLGQGQLQPLVKFVTLGHGPRRLVHLFLRFADHLMQELGHLCWLRLQ